MRLLLGASAIALCANGAFAAGLDRSGQPVGVLFEDGRHLEFSFGFVSPDVTGTDAASSQTGNVANSYLLPSIGYKADLDDVWSYAVIFDQPYGGDVEYGSSSPVYGGTMGKLTSSAITALAQYNMGNGFSLHGGARGLQVNANVTLSGAAYGGSSGYTYSGESDWEFGFVAGAAYERPDIALRVALTYSSEIDLEMDSTESNPSAFAGATIPGTFDVTVPSSINLDIQTGIMADTLLFGSVRYVPWDGFNLTPALLGGGALVEYEDDRFTFNVGVGRRFSDEWSGAVSIGFEPDVDRPSGALGPTNGYVNLGVGGTYTMDTGAKITAGVRYILPGDSDVASGGSTASFDDNSSLAFGLKYAMPL